MNSNAVTITGTLTREPEIRYTKEGQAKTQMTVEVTRRWQEPVTAEWEESTSLYDVIAWRSLAENVALTLTKGMRVIVTGRLDQRTSEIEVGDQTVVHVHVEITADDIGPSLIYATADVMPHHRAYPDER